MTAPAPSTDLSRRFEAFIEALCQCVAAEGVKHRIAGPLVVLIWTRLRRLATRFSRIIANLPSHPEHHRSGKSGRSKNLPRGFAWLPRLMPATTAFAGQFRALLAEPELQHLIATTLSIGRILRPLCHTLGIRVSAPLALPPRKRKPRKRGEPRDTEPGSQTPTTTASRSKHLPSCLEPRPDIPGWPRFPGATRFFAGLKFRT